VSRHAIRNSVGGRLRIMTEGSDNLCRSDLVFLLWQQRGHAYPSGVRDWFGWSPDAKGGWLNFDWTHSRPQFARNPGDAIFLGRSTARGWWPYCVGLDITCVWSWGPSGSFLTCFWHCSSPQIAPLGARWVVLKPCEPNQCINRHWSHT